MAQCINGSRTGKHPQDTEDLLIRLCSTMRAEVLTEAVSGRDEKPSEISVVVSENMIDFTSWDATKALQLCSMHRAFCFPLPVFWVWLRMKKLIQVSFLFVLWCFSSVTSITSSFAWVLTSYVLVAVLFAPVKLSLEIRARSQLTINQIKNNLTNL